MPSIIIYDPEHNIAALVDPDAPAALGPIATGDPGDDPRQPLQEFVEGLSAPPEGMPTWVLFNEWQAYVRAIVQMVEDEVQAAQETPSAPEATNDTGEGTGEAEGAGGSPTDPVAEGPPTEEPAGEEPAEDEEAAKLSEAIAAAPHTPAKDGRVECWLCHGDLEIDSPTGRQVCPVCRGEGSVPIDHTEPA